MTFIWFLIACLAVGCAVYWKLWADSWRRRWASVSMELADRERLHLVKDRYISEQVLAAEQTIMAVKVFYDEHRDLVMDLERRGIMKEGGLYRENLPLLLTVMASIYKEATKTS